MSSTEKDIQRVSEKDRIVSLYDKKLTQLRKECEALFDLKDKPDDYWKEATRIMEYIVHNGLADILNPDYFGSLFIFKRDRLGDMDRKSFTKFIEDNLRIKEIRYFFQVPELVGFPESYQLGHGKLISFEVLPEPVKEFARSLARREITHPKPHVERILKEEVKRMIIPDDPGMGCWLEIPVLSVRVSIEQLFKLAEESLDILRIVVPTSKIDSLRYSIGLDEQNNAFLVTTIKWHKYHYSVIEQHNEEEIRRLNKICVKPTTDLEKRVKDALLFFRIGENSSSKHQELFYYAAGIERLILTSQPPLTHKFRERGAIILGNNLDERQKISEEMKKIYTKRSEIAHGASTEYDYSLTFTCKFYLSRIISKITNLIETAGLKTVKTPKVKKNTSLQEYVEKTIYSDYRDAPSPLKENANST